MSSHKRDSSLHSGTGHAVNSVTGTPSHWSHPAIQFKHLPVVPGPLSHLETIRSRLLAEVVQDTKEDLSPTSLDLLLGEALYSERLRIKRASKNIFTRERFLRDHQLWNRIHNGLLKPAAEVDRKDLLDQVICHYAEEIGGHFDSRVYQLATRAVPWGFSWLLNAASVRRFLPWGMTESLSSRLRILGEIPLVQKLAGKGTILLVPTHQSNIDSVLIGYVIYLMSLPPFAYGAGLNLFNNPILNFFMSRLGSYTVDRMKNNAIYKSTLKKYSTRILREGIHSIFFPGGGRSKSGAIETHPKLGLLGTGLSAQIQSMKDGRPNPKVYVVPMVTSYHFVLEASSQIEAYLAELGKHRYIGLRDPWTFTTVIGFFWKVFSSQSEITVRIGKPLDVFGNEVDEEGQSIGPNGCTIDPTRWLTTRGQLCEEPQRDAEYTRQLGVKISDRFHKDNTTLTSHWVAFAFFETLRAKYSELDLFRLLRLLPEQRSLLLSQFMVSAEQYWLKLKEYAQNGALYLSQELNDMSLEAALRDGVKKLGWLHDSAPLKIRGDIIYTEDMNLLYYYRNRLAGYGLSLLAQKERLKPAVNLYDSKGFLA